MAAGTYFKINGVAIKTPSKFKIERYNITTANRLANGDMSMELIAKKRKFFLTWDALDKSEITVILNQIWETNSMFYRLDYFENGVAKNATVYCGAIPTDLHTTRGSNWVWKDVEIHLIEK